MSVGRKTPARWARVDDGYAGAAYVFAVPEPSSITLLGLALLGVLAYACRERRGRS